MTTVSGAGGAEPTIPMSTVSLDAMPLNEAAIILMLQRRNSDLDAQVRGVMGYMQEQTARSEAVQQKIEALQAIQTAYLAKHPAGESKVELGHINVNWEGEQITAYELMNKLGIDSVGLTGGGSGTAESMRRQYADAVEWLEANPDATGLGRRMQEVRRDVALQHFEDLGRSMDDPDPMMANNKLNGQSLSAAISQLEGQSRRINSGNELQMVRLQSAMDQRSQVITMATQMLKSMGDTAKSVARNIG